MKINSGQHSPTYGRLVSACAMYGISRGKAFEYQRRGLIETFLMDGGRYVLYSSLETLPQRLGAR